jgi:hypothetical protein
MRPTGIPAALALLVALLAPATAGAEIYAPVKAEVDDKRCTGPGAIDVCKVPSGETISFSGSEIEVGNEEVPAGTPVRIATAGPSGPVSVGESTVSDFPSWSIRVLPRISGTVYAAQVLVGGAWQVIPLSQAEARVFVELRSTQRSAARGYPVTFLSQVEYVARDGAGRAILRRCRFAALRRCDSRADFPDVVATQPMRRKGGGKISISTRSRLAYGRPLALFYKPASKRLGGDMSAAFAAVPRSYR